MLPRVLWSYSSCAPVVVTECPEARDVHSLVIGDFETAVRDEVRNVTIHIAAACETTPGGIPSVLLATHVFVGCNAVFTENQRATGL